MKKTQKIRKFLKIEKINKIHKLADFTKILQKTQKKFTDELFLPNSSSLFNNQKKPKHPLWSSISFLRLSSLFSSPPPLQDSSNSSLFPTSFLQHKYLFSAFFAISQRKRILRKIFEDQKFNEKGVYYAKICQNGQWTHIILDDFLPCIRTAQGFSHAFMQTTGAFWPLLLEKAFAKIYHSYESLEFGDSIEVLRDLTGFFRISRIF